MNFKNELSELRKVCEETETKFEFENGFIFDFVRIKKIGFCFNKTDGKYLYCFKIGQKIET